MEIKNIRTDLAKDAPYGPQRDACAIYLGARKHGLSTFGTLKRSLDAMAHMGHRTGLLNGEGDGVGVQTDIPRRLWAKILSRSNLRSSLAIRPGFWVGHLIMPHGIEFSIVQDEIFARFKDAGLPPLIERPGRVSPEALGHSAPLHPPRFWQLAGYAESADLEKQLLLVQTQLEANRSIHFASLSSTTVVYKIRGSVETLARYYPDLQDRDYDTSIALCHARYSTNTDSSFERAQPFALLGHNGEINTISRLRQEAKQIGVALPEGASDSQVVDRTLHTLCVGFGLDLIEAMELIFPPVPHKIDRLPAAMRPAYTRMRRSFGPFAQGPAAIVARYGNLAVSSVDELGLRPLWFVETEKEYIFSSERGVIPLENMVTDPRPLAPGEKMALKVNRGKNLEVLTNRQINQHVVNKSFQRETMQPAERHWIGWDQRIAGAALNPLSGGRYPTGVPGLPQKVATRREPQTQLADQVVIQPGKLPWENGAHLRPLDATVLAAAGWQREHLLEIASVVKTGKDPIGSLGYDGPLAVLSNNRVNIADYFKETVAVVTNPSIDRGREGEVFSIATLVGVHPEIGTLPEPNDKLIVLESPLLPGGHPSLGSQETAQEVARQLGVLTIEQLQIAFGERGARLVLGIYDGEDVIAALGRLADEANEAVRAGAQCLIIDDAQALENGLGWLDPLLATSYVERSLRKPGAKANLRRQTGIVVRAASIRTLHDIALLCGYGADAINPYAMLNIGLTAGGNRIPEDEEELIQVQYSLLKTLGAGLEKVISTMGCHELRGYGRVCSAIGLAPSVAEVFQSPNYFGNEEVGLTWERLKEDSAQRGAELRGERTNRKLAKVDRIYPKFWKKVEACAKGETDYPEAARAFRQLSAKAPVALRHVVGAKKITDAVRPADVDLSISGYSLPLVIGAMSFGSQGELPFRAYAHAASLLNIICINGEGGELPEIMGRYKRNRGQQVASARFGVNAEFLNSAAVIEIKIGQGAKPGEGGMLPASKVTPQVAEARHTTPHIPLLSPSNNHDLYSIEDLAQLIEELKTINPHAKISVKCPVVPGIGVIALGVAKAGADIINLTGYDGGTGAARKHALQHAGLPSEIGVIQAHRALVEAGNRHNVELWCDGGMKTGEDAIKMILLGANRVGFATMAMVAIGCTICRMCHQGDCHVGITTHIQTAAEAQKKGLRRFIPRRFPQSVEGMVRVFEGIGEEMRQLTAQLGATHLQDLVGRADLLEQVRLQDKLDLSAMFEPLPTKTGPELKPGIGHLLTRPRNNLTRLMSELIVESVSNGECEFTYRDEVMAYDRALGSHLFGELARKPDMQPEIDCLHLRFGPSSIAGNGFAAWITDRVDVLIEGGAQDGVAKGASGGRVAVMRGINYDGQRIDGSVGKSFAYGAQRGILIVQGNADSRACIRLSGADVIFGGEIIEPLDDCDGQIGTRANLKGFACEYMTSGRVVIMGDPGPYAFAGMTGGVVYQHLTPEMGFDTDALERRLARGADVVIKRISPSDIQEIQKLLGYYVEALNQTHQIELADRIRSLCEDDILRNRFVKIVPGYS